MVRASVVKVVGSMPVMDVIKEHGPVGQHQDGGGRRLAAFQQTSGVPLGVKVKAVQTLSETNVKNPTEPGWTRQAFTKLRTPAASAVP